MIFEKILFNIVAIVLFIIIFSKMIKKNNTQYLYLIIIQFIGIALNFIELLAMKDFMILKVIIYILSIIIPIIVLFIEKKTEMDFPAILNAFLAKMMLKIEKNEEAKNYLLSLTNKNAKSYIGHKLLGEIYEKEGKTSSAISEYLKVIDIKPRDFEVSYKIASLLHKEKKLSEATEILQDLLKSKPEDIKAAELLGDIFFEQDLFKEAISVYMNSLRYNPDSYNLYYSLGMAYTMLNDFQNAKEYYEKAAKLNSFLYHSKLSLAQIALIYGELDVAELYLFESLKDEKLESGSYYYLAQIAMIKGDKDKAINYLNVAIELDPEIYVKVNEESIFVPIKNAIKKPEYEDNKEENKEEKDEIQTKEDRVVKHLEKTYSIVGELNNNDITMMKNLKEKTDRQRFKER